MQLRGAHHAEAAIVERDEREIGTRHHRTRVLLRHVATQHHVGQPGGGHLPLQVGPPGTTADEEEERLVAELGGGVQHGAEAMADSGVAEVEDDHAAVHAQRVVPIPGHDGDVGELLDPLPVGDHLEARPVAGRGVLRAEQLDHGTVEPDDHLYPTEQPAVEATEAPRGAPPAGSSPNRSAASG